MEHSSLNKQAESMQALESPTGAGAAAGVKSAERVLDLLELLSVLEEPLGVSEIARRLRHPKSSVSLLLNTLEARGYAVAESGRQFRLNPAYRNKERSWVGGPSAQLLRIAVPLMRKLVDTVSESSMLGLLTLDCEIQYIAKVITATELRYDPDISAPRPSVLTSAGLVLLAFQHHEIIEKFLLMAHLSKDSDGKPVTPASLFERLEAIRKAGYAINHSVLMEGVSGVAAPIFGADGHILAAVNIVAPTPRFNKNGDYLREELLLTTEAITRLISPAASKKPRKFHTP